AHDQLQRGLEVSQLPFQVGGPVEIPLDRSDSLTHLRSGWRILPKIGLGALSFEFFQLIVQAGQVKDASLILRPGDGWH
ncbi:MAG: hypothetical protein IH977_05615, partial [Nitrospinae bacterium]|nr:hypothetical protein [Nitrospinota bacterium]